MSDTYGGAVGAFPYAFRVSDSRLFRSYVAVSGVLAALLIVFFVLALPLWIAETVRRSAIEALSRAFLVLVWLALVSPLIAPVLLVARRHRLGRAVAAGYDAALAAAGYLFVVGTYLGLLIAAPADARGTPPDWIALVVDVLYALPRPVGILPPLVAVALIVVVHRRLGRVEADGTAADGTEQ